MDKKLIYNGKVVTPAKTVKNGFIVIRGNKIQIVGSENADGDVLKRELSETEQKFDAGGNTVLPGMIDIHTHGALGKDYSSSPELVFEDALFRATKGVTGFLPTVGCFAPPEFQMESAADLAEAMKKPIDGSRVLGINMEGPFLHPELGAQDSSNCLGEMDRSYLKRLMEKTGGAVKIMTVSPELPGAMEGIRYLREAGIVPAIGHTLADEHTLDLAIRSGAGLVTHLFNTTYQPEQAVKGVITPGVNEYLLVRDDVMAEFICDAAGAHIHPVMLEVLLRCKTPERLVLISDSFMSPGLEENTPILMPDGRSMVMEGGVNYQIPSRHITGSAMTLDSSVKSLMAFTRTSLNEASIMSSLNPARILGIDSQKGSLEEGKDGDIIMVDDDFSILRTFVEGVLVYER